MFTVLGLGILLGVASAAAGATGGEQQETKNVNYDKDYCKANLNRCYYDNWNCETVASALKDNWVRQDLQKLLDNGYDFSKAVDELVAQGTIKL